MSTLVYRKLDQNHDYVIGNGVSNFYTDIDALAQAIGTRLLLLQGEWWMDTLDGLPLWQKILGKFNGNNRSVIDGLIRDRIQNMPAPWSNLIINITGLSSSYNPSTRAYTYQCIVNSIFGPIQVTGGSS